MDLLNLVASLGSLGSFLLGVVGTGLTAYVVSRNKLSGKIDEKIEKIIHQEKSISKAKESGRLQAISEKIDSIIDEQKCITLTTETIKSDIENSNWRKKENQKLRRQKIELLYEKVVEYYSIRVDFLYPKNIQENELFDSRSYFYSLYSEIVMIIELYFNINNELSDVSLKFSENHSKTIKLATKYTLNKIQPPLDKHEELLKEYTEIYLSLKIYLVQSMRVELGENNQNEIFDI